VQGAQLLTKCKQGIIPREMVLQFSLDRAVTVASERQEATAKVSEPKSCPP